MSVFAVVGLLTATLITLAVGSYFGTRRTRQARASLYLAERRARESEAENGRLRMQLDAERALLERLPDPVILFAADCTIVRLNAAARSTLGSSVPALLRHPGFRAALEGAAERGEDSTAELSLPVPIARELHVSVLIMDGSTRQLLVVLADRTRERAVERMRADFVANASHELRTPLTSVIGFIETLRGPAVDDPSAQTRFLGIMAEQAQRMNRLIDDLLSLSRVELTEHVRPADRVDIANLVDQIAAGFTPLLGQHRMTLDAELDPNLPDITGDEDQLAQVLQNLVENAIKYGRDEGTVRVCGQISTRGGQQGVTLSVHDDGTGIAQTHLPRLTERFYRANTHRSRAVGGTGLGLAIVKHIVNRHRGQLRIESVEGEGTTITVWLPA